MTREQIMADPPGAVAQVIADAERYKRERDEAVGLIREWIRAEQEGVSFKRIGQAKVGIINFLARIEQADNPATMYVFPNEEARQEFIKTRIEQADKSFLCPACGSTVQSPKGKLVRGVTTFCNHPFHRIEQADKGVVG